MIVSLMRERQVHLSTPTTLVSFVQSYLKSVIFGMSMGGALGSLLTGDVTKLAREIDVGHSVLVRRITFTRGFGDILHNLFLLPLPTVLKSYSLVVFVFKTLSSWLRIVGHIYLSRRCSSHYYTYLCNNGLIIITLAI